MKRNSITLLWISFFTGTVIFVFFSPTKSVEKYIVTLLIAAMYTFVIAVGNHLMNEFLNRKYSWVEDTRRRAVWGIVCTIMVNVVLVFVCNYINYIVIQQKDAARFFQGTMGFSNWITVNAALLISAVLHAAGFVKAWKSSTKQEVIQQKLIASSANAQFETLKNQLDPHFLFNSLNVLSSLIDENPDQAQYFTASMSKVYRYVLEQKDKELVTVEEEIGFAKIYTELLKTRFEDSVSFDFQIDPDHLQYYVVPLSLQLLLENCIKHNFATSSRPLHIRVYTTKGKLVVENNLQEREQVKERAGIGLSNIVQRYALLTEENVFIEKSTEYFRVVVPILTQKTNVMNTQPTEENLAYRRASERVAELKGFYGNLASYCLIIPFLIVFNLWTSPQYHWFWWPMLGWGFGVVSHALKVFGIGMKWEEREIQKILEKEKNRK